MIKPKKVDNFSTGKNYTSIIFHDEKTLIFINQLFIININ